MTYPMTPGDGLNEDDESFDKILLDRVQRLAKDNPMPAELSKQIGNWIEPQTEHTETDHEDVMAAIGVAYPLIVAWHADLDRIERAAALDDDLDEELSGLC